VWPELHFAAPARDPLLPSWARFINGPCKTILWQGTEIYLLLLIFQQYTHLRDIQICNHHPVIRRVYTTIQRGFLYKGSQRGEHPTSCIAFDEYIIDPSLWQEP
jgi:hypothetical protein